VQLKWETAAFKVKMFPGLRLATYTISGSSILSRNDSGRAVVVQRSGLVLCARHLGIGGCQWQHQHPQFYKPVSVNASR